METVLQRLEKIATRMENLGLNMSNGDQPSNHSCKDIPTTTTTTTREYTEDVLPKVTLFMNQVEKICSSGTLMNISQITARLFDLTRVILDQLSKYRKPAKPVDESRCIELLGKLIAPDINKAENISSTLRRDDEYFNHVSAVVASLSSLYWFSVNEPFAYVQEMIRAAEFYTNRILSAKKNDANHTGFVHSYIGLERIASILTSLMEFIRIHYPKGVSWSLNETNPECSITALEQSLGDLETPKPAVLQDSNRTETLSPKTAVSKIELNNLNSSNRRTIAKSPKDAIIELVGQRWLVKQGRGSVQDRSQVHVTVAEMKQSVYVADCANVIVRVSGPKVNSVSLDSCEKLDVLIEGTVVSQLECVNCKSIRVQVMSALQTVSVDKTNGFHLYLSPESNCLLYSSLSSEVTLSVKNIEDDSYVENPVPMQFVTVYDKTTSSVSTSVATNPCADAATANLSL